MLNATQIRALGAFAKKHIADSPYFGYRQEGITTIIDIHSSFSIKVRTTPALLRELQAAKVREHCEASNLAKDSYTSNSRLIPLDELEYVSRAMAEHDVRYYLNGLAVYHDGSLAATDGHRLHFTGDGKEKPSPMIVPVEVVRLCLKFKKCHLFFKTTANEQQGRIELRDKDNIAQLVMHFRFIEGKYPPIDRVIPKDAPKDRRVTAKVASVADLNDMVRLAKGEKGTKFSSLRANGSYVSNDDRRCELPAPLDCKWPFEQALNPVYLRDALRGQGQVTVHFGENAGVPPRFDTFTHKALIMPVRL